MKRKRQGPSENAGSDSFLDIVSNIVGILIILVMIVGSRVTHFVVAEEAEKPPVATKPVEDLTNLRKTARALHDELGSMVQESRKLDDRLRQSDDKTLRLGTEIRIAERKMQAQRDLMNDDARHVDKVAQQLVEEKAKLLDLRKAQLSATTRATPVVRVQSYPTPISETVFGTEEHFRLRGGRIVRIPFKELQDELIGEKSQLLWRLKDLDEVAGSVGPIEGFKLRYHFDRTYNGAALTKGVYVPATTAPLGEPLLQALSRNSVFRQNLMRLDRTNTTITVWTYADSFSEFRTLKKELYTLGFTVAARPLGKDGQIGVSPQGTRSAAQ